MMIILVHICVRCMTGVRHPLSCCRNMYAYLHVNLQNVNDTHECPHTCIFAQTTSLRQE